MMAVYGKVCAVLILPVLALRADSQDGDKPKMQKQGSLANMRAQFKGNCLFY